MLKLEDLDDFLSKGKQWFERLVETIREYAKKLKDNETWLSTTLNSMADAVIATNKLGNVQFMNPIAESLTGWKQEESIGKSIDGIFNIIDEVTRKPVGNLVARVIREELIIGLTNHTVLIAKNGREIPIAESGASIKDDKGNIMGVVLIFQDITERRRLENALKERMKELNAFYELSKILEDPDITVRTLMQKIVEMILKSMQYPEITCARIKFRDQEFKTKNFQETKWVLKSDIKVKGELEGLFEISYLKEKPDIDEGPFLKEERALLNALSERIGKIAERMEAEQKLKESNEKEYREAYNRAEFYKDLFTHDINNILHNLFSGVELSEMYIGDPEKIEKLREINSIIKNQINRGAKLVSNIRKLSKLEENEISIKKIEICSILEKSITFIKNSYQDRDMNIQVDSISERLYIQANELLEDVFENILINAVKYNENPKVEIIVKISREQMRSINYLKMEFLDNSIGIDDFRKKLIFQRGHIEGKGVHGLGLGLSLVKKIIETYNGKIWVQNRVKGDHSKGSNLVLLIPEVL